MSKELYWKFHFSNFRKELIDNNAENWIFKQPMNILTGKLIEIANHAAETNDEKLIGICCSMALYEFSDPLSKEYDKDRTDRYLNQKL